MSKNRIKQVQITKSQRINPKVDSYDNLENNANKNPSFCFKHISKKHGLKNCEKNELISFCDTLCKLSNLTWNEIINNNRHKLGLETIKIKSLKIPINKDLVNDDHLIAIRFYNKKPMLGFRQGCIYHIMFLDCKMNLYDHS